MAVKKIAKYVQCLLFNKALQMKTGTRGVFALESSHVYSWITFQ